MKPLGLVPSRCRRRPARQPSRPPRPPQAAEDRCRLTRPTRPANPGRRDDGDGVANIMDPADAIYSAAHYLCANGAGRGPAALSNAIFHYNHADWYVEMVLKLSGMYSAQYS